MLKSLNIHTTQSFNGIASIDRLPNIDASESVTNNDLRHKDSNNTSNKQVFNKNFMNKGEDSMKMLLP